MLFILLTLLLLNFELITEYLIITNNNQHTLVIINIYIKIY